MWFVKLERPSKLAGQSDQVFQTKNLDEMALRLHALKWQFFGIEPIIINFGSDDMANFT